MSQNTKSLFHNVVLTAIILSLVAISWGCRSTVPYTNVTLATSPPSTPTPALAPVPASTLTPTSTPTPAPAPTSLPVSTSTALPVLTTAPVTVAINPAQQQVPVGSTVTVEIKVTGVTNLFGAEVHLAFDPARLQVQDADGSRVGIQINGGPLLDPGHAFVAANAADNTAGRIGYALALLRPSPPVSGDGVLASITFAAKEQGIATVSFESAVLADSGAKTIAAVTRDGIISIVARP